MSDETRALEDVEHRARHELRVGHAIVRWKADRRVGARPTRRNRLRRAGDEFDIEQASVAVNAQLRPIRYGSLRAEVEWSAPASLVEGKQLDPDLHVADGTVGSHVPLRWLSRRPRSRT